MFKRISHIIALQFTAFVFGLLVINGALFLAADLGNAHMQTKGRLSQTAQMVLERMSLHHGDLRAVFPRLLRDRVRIANADGTILYSGDAFEVIPFLPGEGFFEAEIDGENYTYLSVPIIRDGTLEGFVQVADTDRLQLGDIPRRALLYLLLSAGISILTFMVGLFFARRSLEPAEAAMHRLEQFTQDASHELRTPLAALNSSLDLALKKKQYHEGILSAKEDVKQLSLLADRLLALARLDGFVLATEKIDFSMLVEQAVEKHRPLAEEKKIAIESSVAASVTVHGDPSLLGQVLGNLLGNAIKFNRPGGVIRVRLTKSALTIEDTGSGIAKEDLPRIFDRFYQADASRARGGFGLGLALVKRIVDLHGWTISVRSELGKGTAFTIALRP